MSSPDTTPDLIIRAIKDDDLLRPVTVEHSFYAAIAHKWRANKVWRKGYIINDLELADTYLTDDEGNYETITKYLTFENIQGDRAQLISYLKKHNAEQTRAMRAAVTEGDSVELVGTLEKYVYRSLLLLQKQEVPEALMNSSSTPDEKGQTPKTLKGLPLGANLTDINTHLTYPLIRAIAFLIKSGQLEAFHGGFKQEQQVLMNMAFTVAPPYDLIKMKTLQAVSTTEGTHLKEGSPVTLNVYSGGRRALEVTEKELLPPVPGLQQSELLQAMFKAIVLALPKNITVTDQTDNKSECAYKTLVICTQSAESHA